MADEVAKKVEKLEAKMENKVEKAVEKKVENAVEKKLEAKVDTLINKRESDLSKTKKEGKARWILQPKNTGTVLSEEEKVSLLEEAKISLWIDSYEELFSDFDPRTYSKREISADFLAEAKRFARERLDGTIDLVILTPNTLRNKQTESVIKKRLREAFTQQYHFLLKKKKKILKQGIVFILLGIFFMIVTTFILFNFDVKDYLIYFLAVLGEPAGWFLFWEGLNLIVFDSKEKNSDLTFNQKMSKINIVFESYE